MLCSIGSVICLSQIALGDVILLNKTDLVPQQTLEQLEEKVHAVNPTANVHTTTRSKLVEYSSKNQ